jgi:3-keto-disaccharide hydrolase
MRWTTGLALVALVSATALSDEGKERAFKFNKDDVGKVPTGWKVEKTGRGEGSDWKIVEDTTAPSGSGVALAQVAKSPGGVFNICVAEDTNYKDLELSVSFKAVAGDSDQGGGFVWRYKDNNNYYICRMNPLEDNYRVYHVVNGRRVQIGGKEGIKVPVGEWHKLKVEVKGNTMEGYLDGQKIWEVTDDTFKDPGKVGLWSKADAQSHFDEFKVEGQ